MIMFTRKLYKNILKIMAFLMVCLFLVHPNNSINTFAKDTFLANYSQTIYNQTNGIGSNEVNCLLQSSSGYVWIGTDSGLYRSNGSEFKCINLWDTDRADVYVINCLMQDTAGRVWIGTDNYGLFYIEDGESHHFQDEYYKGIKNINSICENEDGQIFVASTKGLYICNFENEQMKLDIFPNSQAASINFTQIVSFNNNIFGIRSDEIYKIGKDESVKTLNVSEIVPGDELNCMSVIGKRIYIGTSGNDILKLKGNMSYDILETSVYGITKIIRDNKDTLWACGDNGLGFFNDGNFLKLSDCEIDNYLSDIIQDYEGNYWISSRRLGVLLLSESKFTDYNMLTGMPESMVNSVYVYRAKKYICTDDGLTIYNASNDKITNELTEMLEGVSVRHFMVDSEGNMWISTNRKYGLLKYMPDGTYETIMRMDGLPSSSVNMCIELNDGKIVVATESGLALVNKSCQVERTYKDNNFNYSILCMCQGEDDDVYVGTDGGGLFVFTKKLNTLRAVYTTDDGLNSNTITTITNGQKGTWIGTSNGVCFYNEAYRAISNIEYSNSIYDILIHKDNVWIISSMGVIRTSEEELLGTNGLSERYFDSNDGLNKTINSISNSCIDINGILYICCDTGISMINTKKISYNMAAPKIKVTSIDVDGKIYEFDDLTDGLKIKSDVSRITIDFAVFSYQNRGNMQIEYSLKGFDSEPIIISGNDTMQAVYTNLDGGVYKFRIDACNGDGTPCDGEVSFLIEKEINFMESSYAKWGLLSITILVICLIIIGIFRLKISLSNKNKEYEKLSKEHEVVVKSSSAKNDYLANMSNEIKIPINAMVSKADEIIKLMGEDYSYRANVEDIYNIGTDIIDKVDDIILLAKIEAGKIDIVENNISITSMVYKLADYAKQIIKDKPIKLFVEFDENITDAIVADFDVIYGILSRIIDNSVKFTKEGSVTISVDSFEYMDKEHMGLANVVYSISDTGIGIQEERLADIFEVYNIADNKKNNIFTGNGIGLAIANGYAKLVDAKISVESVYGAGSTFTLTMDSQLADLNNNQASREPIYDIVSKEVAEKLWLPEVNALLVDDENVSRDVSARILADFGMNVDIADSGVFAIDMSINKKYDVCFMDLTMPIMNGVETMKEIRELDGEHYKTMPIVALDYDAIDNNKQQLIEAGFTAILVKPIDVRKAAAILKDCLSEDKIKEKTSDVADYIRNSKFYDGLKLLDKRIKLEKAIEKTGTNIDVYNKMIESYYEQNYDVVDIIYQRGYNDTKWIKSKLHSIKNANFNIGAYDMGHEAAKLEAALNASNMTYFKNNIDGLLKRLKSLIEAVGDYVDYLKQFEDEGANEEQTSDEVANEEPAHDIKKHADSIDLHLLKELKTAILKDDKTKIDILMKEINSFDYSGENVDFVDVFNKAYLEMDFDAMSELILTYLELNA